MKRNLILCLCICTSVMASSKIAIAIKVKGKVSVIQKGSPEKQSLKPGTALSDQDKILDRKSTRLNSSHKPISYAVFCLKKKKKKKT